MSSARILVVDDEADIRELLKEILEEEGYEVAMAQDAAAAREACREQSPDLVLLDIWMPQTDGITLLRTWREERELDFPVVMMSGHGTVDTAVEATRLGACDYVEKPISLHRLLSVVQAALQDGRGRRKPGRQMMPDRTGPIGKAQVVQLLREQIKRVARHEAPLLIVGEPGSGRESLARYAHSLSARAAGPFVQLAAIAITDTNAEEQILGRADDGHGVPGLIEQANEGVLFINELQELVPFAQRLLLGVLERGSFERVGSQQSIPLTARIITSVGGGYERQRDRVRPDLLAHLNVVPVHVPPLRDYAEDVPDLLRHHVDYLVESEGLPFRRFNVAAQNRLRNYPWPGNLQELHNLVKRLLILGGDEEIALEEVESQLAADAPENEPLVKQDLLALPLREAREQFERAYLQQQLQLCGGKVQLLAKRVGMERTHLYRKLKSLDVDLRQSTDD
jgi:two-component system nitrogen regulation response regulator NtrX